MPLSEFTADGPASVGEPIRSSPQRDGSRRARAVVALSTASMLACVGLFANNWLQRGWLRDVFLVDRPSALEEWRALAALSFSAWVATVLAARRGRARAVLPPALRWIPVALIGAWFWSWQLAIPRPAVVAQLALSAATCAWAMLLAAGAWRASWPRWLARVERVLMACALCILATELGLRAWRALAHPQLLATPGVDVAAWMEANRRPPNLTHNAFVTDSAGFPDEEPSHLGPNAPWVACVGDSFSVGVVPHHRHYTTLAERELGVPIYNLGVGGAGPREYLHMLREHALPRAPRLVVVALFIGNDVQDAARRDKSTLEQWIDADEALVRVALRRAWALARVGRLDLEARIEGAARPSLEQIERQLPWLRDPELEKPTFTAERFQYIEMGRAKELLVDSRERYELLFEWLDRIRDAVAPTPLACLLIPDEFQVEDELWSALRRAGLPDGLERDLPQRLIGEWLAQRGVEFVDLLPELRAVEPRSDGRRGVYHFRDTHFNARGNEIAARGLVELVRRSTTR